LVTCKVFVKQLQFWNSWHFGHVSLSDEDLWSVMTLKASTRTPSEARADGLADRIPNGIRQDFIADVLFEQLDHLIQLARPGT
jgi:hypothetical protein